MSLRVSTLHTVLFCFGMSVAPAHGTDVPPMPATEVSRPQGEIPPFAPALYTLRATQHGGSSLVLLDVQGRETVIATDDRPAKAKGAFGGIAHATHFGPFSATPDLSKVIYTTFGKPGGSGGMPIGIGIGGIGVGVVLRDPFGTAELEGIYLWDQSTGKSERLWDAAALKDIGKTWRDTAEGKTYDGAKKLHKDLELNSPKWIFHLGEFSVSC